MEPNNELVSMNIKTIYKSPKANRIKHFISHLPIEDVFSIAQTACNKKISLINKEEAVDTILIYTTDVERFFSYRRITSSILSQYLYSNNVVLKGRETRTQLIAKVIEVWDQLPVRCDLTKPVVKESIVARNEENDNTSKENSIRNYMKSDTFAYHFAEWFYLCLNNVHDKCSSKGSVIDSTMFCSNASLDLFMMNPSFTKNIHGEGAQECERALRDVIQHYSLTFNPNLETGTQAIKSNHGLIKVLSCGTLHTKEDFIGVFEQEFGVVQSPNDKNWKIFYTKANFKSSVIELPVLPPCPVFEIECG